ncbi:hypothetical protein QBC38DRAFT_34365 [Podospora fimiseda]|uniref:Monooxygenase n=1 Tax=Podospora fimiseda TaxID=252190 RepID=A0AAN7BIQ6_9PEZI|nr:hypothetical protein QBC38DRAFT_34365 [Podospora fimiseda]
MATQELDIVIIGAGVSGINAAYRLQNELPARSFTILESRTEMGGTWDFWKYPGIRTDSAMALFGFPWRPWPYESTMAQAQDITNYMKKCAAQEGIDKKIQFRNCVKSASWNTEEQRWTLQVDATLEDGSLEKRIIKSWWLIVCSGYYSYEKVQPAAIPGIDTFKGQVVHPQFWDDKVDYAGKKVIIIGSGATAITLLPAMADTAGSLTMLQRSPSFIFSLPRKDKTVQNLSRWMPKRWAVIVNWWQRMFIETAFVKFILTFPNAGRKFLLSRAKAQLPKGFDIEKHLSPRYDPFQQRLCFSPGGDFYKALHKPNVKIVTDIIETVTDDGILLKSGEKLEADMIITATGLYMALLSSIATDIDGMSLNDTINQRYVWNGCMLEGVPNAGLVTGYTAATWTPGADVRTRKLIKVIKHQEKTGTVIAKPAMNPSERARYSPKAFFNLTSTYAVNALDRLPLSAGVGVWRMGTNWVVDVWQLMFSSVKTGMQYVGKSKDV